MNSGNTNFDYSVVIPLYNGASTIIRALKSCANQTVKPSVVVVVDNNSKDDGLSVVKDYSKDAQIHILCIKESNPGANFARNKGLETVTTKYVQFLDADDELLSEKLEQQMLIAEKMGADLVNGGYKMDDGQQFIPDCKIPVELQLFRSQIGLTSCLLFQTQSLKDIGGWNSAQKSSQEAEVVYRLLKANKTVICSSSVHTLIHADAVNRISTNDYKSNAERFIKLRLEIMHWLKSSNNESFRSNESQFAESLFRALMSLYNADKSSARELLKTIPKAYWRRLSIKSKVRKYMILTVP